MSSNKEHPQQDEIERLIRLGHSDRWIAESLHVWRPAVKRIRVELGVAPISLLIPVERRLALYCTEPDADGHVLWTGSYTTGGVPRLRHQNREVSVSGIVYRRHFGRKAVGIVKADCGVRGCVEPTHLMDELDRRRVRMATRNIMGLPTPWTVCAKCGGSWEECGRVDSDLTTYCRACGTDRSRRNRSKKGE